MLATLLTLALADTPTAPTPADLAEAEVPEALHGLPWFGPDQLTNKKRQPPQFPKAAAAAGLPDAKCTAFVHIDSEGKVAGTWVTDCPQAFEDATKEALRDWVWKPQKVDGEPVAVLTTVGMSFKIR